MTLRLVCLPEKAVNIVFLLKQQIFNQDFLRKSQAILFFALGN